MKRIFLFLILGACLITAGLGKNDKGDKRERKQREKIEDLAEKLGRRMFAYPEPTSEQIWLHNQAAALLERTKNSVNDPYRFDRLARATDALLEASERILDARKEEEGDKDDREDAARHLEKGYFRVQQSNYFAEKCQEKNAAEYTGIARSLYQQARGAYDAGKFRRAETLGDAASYVVRALESLAQAAIRVPEPPRLK